MKSKRLIQSTILVALLCGTVMVTGSAGTSAAGVPQVDCQLCDADIFLLPPFVRHIFAGSGAMYGANIHYHYKAGDCWGQDGDYHVNCDPQEQEQFNQLARLSPMELAKSVQESNGSIRVSEKRGALLFYASCSPGAITASRQLPRDVLEELLGLL